MKRLRVPATWAPYLLVSPFLLLFAVFGLFPLLFSLWMAFQSWEPTAGLEAMQFVGLDNLWFVLGDGWFWKSLYNTLWLALVSALPQHLLALPLAALIDRGFGRWGHAVSTVYFLPYITSTVAVAMMFTALLSTEYGTLNAGLGLLGVAPINWLWEPQTIKPAVAMVVFWRYLGFNVVLYLAALQAIPRELYQAARVDGAGAWAQFRFVTLPALRPMILFAVTLSVIGGVQLFEEPFILTVGGRGGPDQAAMTVAMYVYRLAFDFSDFGAASAISWLVFVLLALLTWLTNRAFREGRT